MAHGKDLVFSLLTSAVQEADKPILDIAFFDRLGAELNVSSARIRILSFEGSEVLPWQNVTDFALESDGLFHLRHQVDLQAQGIAGGHYYVQVEVAFSDGEVRKSPPLNFWVKHKGG